MFTMARGEVMVSVYEDSHELKYSMIVVLSYGKYPRSIARVFIDLYSVQQLT